jgi:hypothetical protein
MKKIIFLFLICVMPVFPTTLTVLNNVQGSKVYVSGMLIGAQTVNDFNIQPGTYMITVKLGDYVIYSRRVTIRDGEDKVVNTHQVDVQTSEVANKGESEEKRIRSLTKSKFAVGAKFGKYVTGLSLKWFPIKKVGAQVIAWTASNTDDTKEQVQVRIIREISDEIAFSDVLLTVYSGVGLGKYYERNGNISLLNPPLATDTKIVNSEVFELLIGIEFPIAASTLHGFVESTYVQNKSDYFTFEDVKTSKTIKEFILVGGFHFYF